MAKVIITSALRAAVEQKFKEESVAIFELMHGLSVNPKKGDAIGAVGNIAIKEITYKKFRFYFLVNRYKIKFLKASELQDLLIKFVRMSEKKDQQKVIDEIKRFLKGQDTSDVV
jgi:hypothetical protein